MISLPSRLCAANNNNIILTPSSSSPPSPPPRNWKVPGRPSSAPTVFELSATLPNSPCCCCSSGILAASVEKGWAETILLAEDARAISPATAHRETIILLQGKKVTGSVSFDCGYEARMSGCDEKARRCKWHRFSNPSK